MSVKNTRRRRSTSGRYSGFPFVFCGKTVCWRCNELTGSIPSPPFSSSSLDDAEDPKTVIKDDKQEGKHNNKLPQVNTRSAQASFSLDCSEGFLGQVPGSQASSRSVGYQAHPEASGRSCRSGARSWSWSSSALPPAISLTERSSGQSTQDQHLPHPGLRPLPHRHHQLRGPGPRLHQGLRHDRSEGLCRY